MVMRHPVKNAGAIRSLLGKPDTGNGRLLAASYRLHASLNIKKGVTMGAFQRALSPAQEKKEKKAHTVERDADRKTAGRKTPRGLLTTGASLVGKP